MKNASSIVKPIKTTLFTFLFLLTAFLTIPATAQESSVTDKISKALKAGSATKLASHFNASIDLAIPGDEGTYSKKQAEQIMKMFFTNNPVKTFALEHSGNSNSGSHYLIGSYVSTNKKSYRVYILIKGRETGELIQQLQFEEE